MKYLILIVLSLFVVGTTHAQEILYPEGEKDRKEGAISWYAKGVNKDGTPFNPTKLTAACWKEYRYKTFRVTYNGNSIVVRCNDTGPFREMERVLDLSSGAFRRLAPLSKGILRGAKVEVLR